LAHPTRRAILGRLAGHERPLSPAGFARLAGVKLSPVPYHFRYLARHGLIELDRVERHAATVEHFYALTAAGRTVARSLGNAGTDPPA
jgi:DNA-binding transcriptional ArsR family regulator